MKRIVVVGLGSMGKRRIRLIKQIDSSLIVCGVDAQASRREETAELFGICCYDSLEAATADGTPEIGFVCASPLAHYAIITELLRAGAHVFTELNLVEDGYEEMITLAQAKRKNLFLSSPFLFRKDVRYIIEQSQQRKVDYIYHTGQYLPDWHPWETYKDFFVSNVRTDACREIMAVDFPWLLAAFGKVKDVHVRRSKNSNLELNYEDNYLISLEHENGSKGVFVCDLLSRRGGRSMEIFSEDLYLTWRGTPDSLERWDIEMRKTVPVETYAETLEHQDTYAANIIENAYRDEIEHFFRTIDGEAEVPYTFEDDLYTIRLINQIEGRS